MKCEYCGCELNAGSELATGLCDRHRELLESKKTYAGICWKCNRITLIDEIPKRLKEVFQDKYLITAECSLCSNVRLNDINWVTFSRFNPNHRMTVDEGGRIYEEEASETVSDGGSRKILTKSHNGCVDVVEMTDVDNSDEVHNGN